MKGDGNVKLLAEEAPQKDKISPGVMMGSSTPFKELTAQHVVSDLLTHTTVFTEAVSMADSTGSKMECDKLELYAKPQKSALGKAPAAATEDPDADPFELTAEKSVPNSLVVGNGLELDNALATGKVMIDRRAAPRGPRQKIFCERAFFNSKEMTLECTGDEKYRPHVEGAGKKHYAEKFTVFLKDERLESSGATVTK